jgi:HAD superfamily hydrolase (TIGR01509 family)
VPWDLVIFDNDGVLVDSERLANQVLARLLTELGRPTTFDECVESYLGGTIERVRSLVEKELGGPLPGDFEERYHAGLFAAFDAGLVAVPGVEAVLDGLLEASTPFCVASSGSRERIRRSLRRVGLEDRFEGRAFSAEEVPHGKPAPDLFLHAAARLGADPAATVVVEDSPLGVEAALAAGMRVIGFAALTPPERLAQAAAGHAPGTGARAGPAPGIAPRPGPGPGAIATTMQEVGALLAGGHPRSGPVP